MWKANQRFCSIVIAVVGINVGSQPTYALTRIEAVNSHREKKNEADTQVVRFDPDQWNDSHKFGLHGSSREDVCSNLLRQYDLIGMSRAEVHLLLGKNSQKKWDKKHTSESYTVFSSCTEFHDLQIRYARDKKVDGYAITSWNDKLPQFIVTNVKPNEHESLRDFFLRNAEPDPYHMFYYPDELR